MESRSELQLTTEAPLVPDHYALNLTYPASDNAHNYTGLLALSLSLRHDTDSLYLHADAAHLAILPHSLRLTRATDGRDLCIRDALHSTTDQILRLTTETRLSKAHRYIVSLNFRFASMSIIDA